MKISTKYTALKAFMVMAAVTAGATGASAASRLSIEPQAFASHQTVNIPVAFDKENSVVGMSFNIALPDFLEFAGNIEKNPDRFTSTQTINFSQATGNVVIASFGTQKEIQGESGTLLYVPVRVKQSVASPVRGNITLSKIVFSGAFDGSVSGQPESWGQDNLTVSASYSPYEIGFTATESPVTINTGMSGRMGVGIAANCPVIGFQADLALPAGFTVSDAVELSTRCPNDAVMTVTTLPSGVTRLVYFNGSNTPLTGNDGLAFTLTINAPADFTAASAQVTMKNIQVSYAQGAYAMADGFTATIINDNPAHERLTDVIAGLETSLANALATIAQDYPDVKDDFNGQEISDEISDLKTREQQLYADGGLTDAEAALNTEAQAISARIDALVADAKAAQLAFTEAQRKAANLTAYNAVLAQISALQAKLDAAKAECASKYPHADITADAQAAQQALTALKTAADNAYAAVENEGSFTYRPDTGAVEALIDAMTTNAKAAQDAYDEAQRKAANQAAYNATLDEINALQQSLDAMKQTVAASFPGIDVNAEINAAQDAINAARSGAKAALDAVATEGTYSYTVPESDIEALIEAVGDKAASVSETNRQEANKAAYDQAIALLDQLQALLDDAIAQATGECPHANVIKEVNAAQTAISSARTQAEVAYVAVADKGLFTYQPDADAIRALIEAVTESAQAQEAAYQEAQRQAANQAAYDKTMAEIDALQQQLDQMKENIAEAYPDSDVTAEINAAQQAITDARDGADAALAAVADEGTYAYTPDADAIKALIAEIENKAKALGIFEISVDQIDADTKVYNLSGIRLKTPQQGAVNVLVGRDGKTTKVIVK